MTNQLDRDFTIAFRVRPPASKEPTCLSAASHDTALIQEPKKTVRQEDSYTQHEFKANRVYGTEVQTNEVMFWVTMRCLKCHRYTKISSAD